MKRECVRWSDARSWDGWLDVDDIDLRLADITTHGYTAREDDFVLCIAQSRDRHTGQLCGLMFIPKQCIVSRTKIPNRKK